jgi:hypothetical protein
MQNGTFPYAASCFLNGPSPSNFFSNGFHGPFFFEGAKLDPDNYVALSAIWSKIIGWKLAISFQNTTHYDFTDAAFFANELPGININNTLGVFVYPDPLMNFHGMGYYQRTLFDPASPLEPVDEILTAADPKYPEIVFENPS